MLRRSIYRFMLEVFQRQRDARRVAALSTDAKLAHCNTFPAIFFRIVNRTIAGLRTFQSNVSEEQEMNIRLLSRLQHVYG